MLAIRTDRLLLRDFSPADLPAYADLRARPASWRFSPEEDARPDKAEELLRLFVAWSEERPRLRYQLAVVVPPRGLIGSVGVRVASSSERRGSFETSSATVRRPGGARVGGKLGCQEL